MSEHIHKTLELVVAQVRQHEEQAAQKKQMANNLCDLAGITHMYPDEPAIAVMLRPLTANSYYGRELATVVAEVLERRECAGLGAATASEIYDSMKAGGYRFATKDDEKAKSVLYISLSKETSVFHRLSNGKYGLLESYPSTSPVMAAHDSGQASERVAKDQEEDEDKPTVEVAESCVSLPV